MTTESWPPFTQTLVWPLLLHAKASFMGARFHTWAINQKAPEHIPAGCGKYKRYDRSQGWLRIAKRVCQSRFLLRAPAGRRHAGRVIPSNTLAIPHRYVFLPMCGNLPMNDDRVVASIYADFGLAFTLARQSVLHGRPFPHLGNQPENARTRTGGVWQI